MQNYLFIGGNHDGLNIPVADGMDAVELPKAGAGEHAYIRDRLSVGNVPVTIYRHESLTRRQVLNQVVEYYKAWAANRPGSRL